MRTVYKLSLEVHDEQTIQLPGSTKLLSAQNQGDEVMVWYSLDEGDETTVDITFYVIGTGQSVPDTFPGVYFKTVQIGAMVWHIFYKPIGRRGKPVVAELDGNAKDAS